MKKQKNKHPQKPRLDAWHSKDNFMELREYQNFVNERKDKREYLNRKLNPKNF